MNHERCRMPGSGVYSSRKRKTRRDAGRGTFFAISPSGFLLSLFILLETGFAALPARAQEPCIDKPQRKTAKTLIADVAMLDVNSIACWIQNDGSIGENPSTGGDGFYYPSGQDELSLIYTGGIWVIGKVDGDIRSAVNSYGSEYQPGSVLPDGRADNPLAEKYHIYKYNKGDAVDAGAIAQGCPEEVLGDQMLFYVMNDFGSHDGMWGSLSLGIEVRQTAFAFDQAGALGNTIFLKYEIINRSSHAIDDAYVAFFFDADVGSGFDDMSGCDSALGIAYWFNGDGYDDRYGTQVPALACDFFQGPVVPAPGETAQLPDGTKLYDQKILSMTAFFVYI